MLIHLPRKLAVALVGAAALLASGAAAQDYRPPRNAFGQPDFSGVWTNASLTSLVRRPPFKTLSIPEAEAQALEAARARAREAQDRPSDPNAPPPTAGSDPGGYNAFWTDPGAKLGRIRGEARTSWIVDPADGQLPFTPEGRRIFESELKRVRTSFEGPESRPLPERCLLGFGSTSGPPMLNVLYNNNYQIVQTPDHVAILVEMNHDVRVIPLGGKRRPRADIRNWMGNSVGWWEGDTLVVETTGFKPDEQLRPYFDNSIYISADAKVTERFTRVSPTQILYRFEVDDPKIYSRVWKAEMPLNSSAGPVYEYACHEGNYSLPGILAGARKAESEGRAPEAVDASGG